MTVNEIFSALEKIPGGYVYSGAASLQVCFPLKAGGELRFGLYDDGNDGFDFYDGALPPGVTGFVKPTLDKAV